MLDERIIDMLAPDEGVPPVPLDMLVPGDDDVPPVDWLELEAAAAADELAAAADEGAALWNMSSDGDEVGGKSALAAGVLSDDEKAARGLATDETLPADGRVRWWEIVAWFDSVEPEWRFRWDARPDVRGLAIWHDRDIKNIETGELKKKHMHVMCGDSHGRKWSARQALRFAHDVFGLRPDKDSRLVRPIKRPASYALYLTHANAPKKAQYRRDEVLCFGGADLDLVVGVVDNEKAIIDDIYAWVDEFVEAYEVLPSYAAVVRFASACRPAWSRVLASRAGRQVLSYLRSYEYDEGLDGRGAGTLRIVRELIASEKSTAAAGSVKL